MAAKRSPPDLDLLTDVLVGLFHNPVHRSDLRTKPVSSTERRHTEYVRYVRRALTLTLHIRARRIIGPTYKALGFRLGKHCSQGIGLIQCATLQILVWRIFVIILASHGSLGHATLHLGLADRVL